MRHHSARFVAGADTPARIPRYQIPEIAFAGRSNVGKSTLLNRLVGNQRLARVSKTPGRTQQINFFEVDESLIFADLPGYGFAKVPLPVKEAWKLLVETYLEERSNLRAVAILVDVRRGILPDDETLLTYLRSRQVAAILVATKLDKLNRSERQKQLKILSEQAGRVGCREVIACSALNNEGIGELWRSIEARLGAKG